MRDAWKVLLRQQLGLITAVQARELGVPWATLHRRTRGARPTWQKVLPRVYATFPHALSDRQRVVAAWLYAGEGAAVSGGAALHWRRVPYLPSEVTAEPVDIVLPVGRDCAGTTFVRVVRTRRELSTVNVEHVYCASTARAAADAARRLSNHDAVLALVTCVVNTGRVSLDELAIELAAGPVNGSRLLRQVLTEAARHVRSVPEAELLRLIDASELPPPLVNSPIVVGGRTFIPDFRWGWLIIEVDSRLHHLLRPGSAQATERRRGILEAAGYHVIPVSPEMIRDDPSGLIAAIVVAYFTYATV
jgi:very-short-patch-repair endonuclease